MRKWMCDKCKLPKQRHELSELKNWGAFLCDDCCEGILKSEGKKHYMKCKTCGTEYGMGIEDMETGIVTPIDTCKTCLFKVGHEEYDFDSLLKQTIEKYSENLRRLADK